MGLPWKKLNPELQADILTINDAMNWGLRETLTKKKLKELDAIIAERKAKPKEVLKFTKEDITRMTNGLM